MFENSPNLKRVKCLENWDTSAGLGFDGMFERCYKLEEVDLSAFNTTKAKNGTTASANGHKTATLQNMFLSCNNLKKVTLGPNFAINGNGSNTSAANKLILPTPSTDYIESADGNWYSIGGTSYTPSGIPDRTACIYFASRKLIEDLDVIIPNKVLLDIAAALREVNGSTNKYKPENFSEAILALKA
jgi:surface protein